MNLRNYTSTVPVERSLAAIEKLLVEAGATHIARTYTGGNITGFIFAIEVSRKPISFKLPANPAAVKTMLTKKVSRPRSRTLERLDEQSQRTAWKLLHDWVHVQISLIQMGQADAVQVFLPYAYNTLSRCTLYEKFKEGGFKALTTGEMPSG